MDFYALATLLHVFFLFDNYKILFSETYFEVTLDLCLEMDSSWPILCGAEIHVGLGLHYPSQ